MTNHSEGPASTKAIVRIFKDSETLSRAAAEIFVTTATQAVDRHRLFLVALSGGSTPMGLYELLVQAVYRERIDWQKTFIFWGDERCVAPDDAESNYREAVDGFIKHLPIPKENILRIKGELGPAEASKDYIRTLKRFASQSLDWPRFDLVFLGMGADGHTASLFPGLQANISAPAIPVTASYQGRPGQRVTLTEPVFNSARRVVFLVTGESKSATLANVLNREYRPIEFPAQRIRPTDGEVIWLVDTAAASKL